MRSLSKRILTAAGPILQPLFDNPDDVVERAVAVAADRGVERQFGTPGAAEQFVDRLAERLPLQVPQGDVDRRERTGQRTLGTELDEAVQHPVLQHGMIERVLADQRRSEVVGDDAERGEPALHRRRFADPPEPVIGVDADKGAALRRAVVRRPGKLERLDFTDFHRPSQ